MSCFKSFVEKELSFSPRVNCVLGPNGSGKTNMLDAVYYLSLCKSFFGTPDSSSINFGQSYFALQGRYVVGSEIHDVSCAFTAERKKVFKRNDKQYERLSEHVGLFPLIMVTPSDIAMINGGSDERRRFFDAFICQLDREYLVWVYSYGKVLADRNKLLKQDNVPLDMNLLSVLNERLAHFGTLVHERRRRTVGEILPMLASRYAAITSSEEVGVRYESQLQSGSLLDMLDRNTEKDRILGHTTSGVHRDDYVFSMDGNPLRNFGSQGQKKSFLLALKFAQYAYTAGELGVKPILILDDLFDKLDMARVQHIVATITSGDFGQVFISDTDRSNLSSMFTGKDVRYIQL